MEKMATSDPRQLLQSVQSLYLEGDYQGAIETLTQGGEQLGQGLFHFNLGTLYLKNEQWGLGRYHLEKALKAGLVSEAQYHNLRLASSQPGLANLATSPQWSERALNTALSVPQDFYFLCSLGLTILGLFFLRRSASFSWGKVFGGLGLACLPSAFCLFFLAELKEAVVLKDSPIREGPSQIYAESITLQEGSKIVVGKRSGNWYFIKYPRRMGGWVAQDHLGLL